MRFLFIIQGEGRGHLTQAISFAQLIRSQGHELVSVAVGKSKRRELPDFFRKEISAPIQMVDSPNFECDAQQRKIQLGKTIWKNALRVPIFWKSLQAIDQAVKTAQPDVILNFYDLLGGFYNLFFQPKARFWVIGHQYLIWHPDFHFAPNRRLEKFLFQLNTQMTALGADEILALSFLPQKKSGSNLRVVPPLLRKEVKTLNPIQRDFFLAYMVNPGYGEEVIRYAKKYPHLQIKAYWDKKEAAEVENPLPNLSFHRVNDRTFLEDMAACKGLVCTAGFESVCEAMYLGKPVIMIPVAGQYEQACNALDAEASGVGIASADFDFGKFEQVQKKDPERSLIFKEWTAFWPKILSEITEVEEQMASETTPIQIPAFQ